MTQEVFPMLDIAGNHYEIGYQHGENFPDRIRGSIKTYKTMFKDYSNLEWEDAKKIARKFIPIIEDYEAGYIDEMKGVADGAGLDFEDILALNCRSELVFAGDEVSPSDGCTSLAATSEATKSGDSLLGHNWDWKTTQRENMIMLRVTQDGDKPKIFMITEAGIIGKTGFNSAGVSVVLNALGTDAAPEGIPLHMVMRRILDCKTIGEAIKISTEYNIGCCANFLIGHSNGETVDIEIENEDYDVLYPENGVLVHTNHFLSPRLPVYPRKDKVKRNFPSTYIRLGRTKKLLNKNHGEITVETIKEILADHVDQPNSICAHNDPVLEPGKQTGTVFSIIINLTQKEIHFAKGSPCEVEYDIYKL